MNPLLLVLPLLLFVAYLVLRHLLGRVQEMWELRQQLNRPQSLESRTPVAEVDVDTDSRFALGERSDQTPYYLVCDTETLEAIPEERDPLEPARTSPVILLSWQLLNEAMETISEETYLIEKRGAVTEEATAIHGITDEDILSGGLPAREVYGYFLRDLRQCHQLVAHNVAFHRSTILADWEKLGISTEELAKKPAFCTMEWGKRLAFRFRRSGEAAYPKLTELFSYLYTMNRNVPIRYSQKGLRDVRLCAACFRLSR